MCLRGPCHEGQPQDRGKIHNGESSSTDPGRGRALANRPVRQKKSNRTFTKEGNRRIPSKGGVVK